MLGAQELIGRQWLNLAKINGSLLKNQFFCYQYRHFNPSSTFFSQPNGISGHLNKN